MRSLDGQSERVLKDTSGDKAAGQALVKESLKISSEDQVNRVELRQSSTNVTNAPRSEQVLQRAREEARTSDVRNQQDQARKTTDVRTQQEQRVNDVRNQQDQTRRATEVRTQEQARRATEIRTQQQRSTEIRNQQDQARKVSEVRTQEQARRATEIRTQQEQRQADVRNQQEQSRRTSEIRTQQDQRRADARLQEQQRTTETKSKQAPGLLSDFGANWQKDDAGNFVTRSRDGRLLTKNADGKLVDYTSHLNQKHMASQDQMAFASILFCNPLMLLGMGAALSVIDQAHGAKTQRMSDKLNQKFDGKQANSRAAQNSYSSEISRKAMLIAQYTRPLDGRDVSTPGVKGMQEAAQQEEERRKETKRKKSEVSTRAPIKLSMPADKYALNAKKLLKTKRLLEEHIEKVRGQASLEEMSRLYSQVEVLDKALKRLANF